MLRFFLASTGGDRARAEDLAQETFVTVVHRADAITSTFRAYCYGVARLKRLEDLRRHGRAATDDDSVLEFIDAPQVPEAERQRGRIAIAALRQISDDDQQLIVLKDYLGFSQAELAEVFKIRAPQVAGRLNRARLRFQRRFEAIEANPVERELTERSLASALASIVAQLPAAIVALRKD